MSGYELASYEPEQREDYLRLLHDAWGDLALSGPEFDWWFKENPVGSLMSVARVGGQVAGVASHSLLRVVLDGVQREVSFSVHATTAESARGLGIFPALETKHEQEAEDRGVAVALALRLQADRAASSSARSAGRRSRESVSGPGRFRAGHAGSSRTRDSHASGMPATRPSPGQTMLCGTPST